MPQPRARRTVQEEHREAVRVAPFGARERPAVGCRDRLHGYRRSLDSRRSLRTRPAGLAGRAVVDRVLLVVDARDRGLADEARLAEPVVDAVDPRVVRAALAQLEPARELLVDRARRAARPPRGSSCVESANGESRAAWRISFAQARPMPAIARWSRSSECSRRESAARISPSRSAPRPSASGPRCASSSSACSGVSSQTPARFFEPASVRTSSPPSWKRSRNAGDFGPFSPAPQVADAGPPTSGGRAARARRPRSGTAGACRGRSAPRQPPALERRQRRVERLQRRDVRRPGALDRKRTHGIVERAAESLDLGQLGHGSSVRCGRGLAGSGARCKRSASHAVLTL